jgi:uncharacterized protein (DUF1778 family)
MNARLSLRLHADGLEIVDRAAAFTGVSTGEFIRLVTAAEAQRVLGSYLARRQ